MACRAPFFTSLLLTLLVACGDGENTTAAATTTSTAETGTTAPGTSDGTSTDPGTTAVTDGTTDGTAAPTTDGSTTTGPTDASSTSTGPSPASCEGDAPRVRLVTTMGDMVVQLDAVNAPITTANFLHYVESGFYAGTIFHRVIDGFVLQGGGLSADLEVKPTDPPIPLEISPALTHIDGAIAMARTADPNSATSQFYVCDGPQHFLDGDYAVFGVLVEGFDVRDAISAVATASEGGYDDIPVTDVIVTSAACE